MKIHPVGAELFHVDRQTDGLMDRHDEASSCFLQFCECIYSMTLRINRYFVLFHNFTKTSAVLFHPLEAHGWKFPTHTRNFLHFISKAADSTHNTLAIQKSFGNI
jgi:hypothetical protein